MRFLVIASLILLSCASHAQGLPTVELLRWQDQAISGETAGFVVHMEDNTGAVEHEYPIGDPSLTEENSVYSVFVLIGPDQTHISVSAYTFAGGQYSIPWSEGSMVRTYNPQPPLIQTDCERADLDENGVVGATDWATFMRYFGKRCS